MNLALKYRPKTFSEVVGQRANCAILAAKIAKGSLDQVMLFTGNSGVGKTSMARIIAAQLNPEGAQDVHEGTHPAILEIDAASNGSVDAIRELKKTVNYAVPGNRVVIIDEAHSMSDQAFAALLNLLEFPPVNVTFILITTEEHKIPNSIKHRGPKYVFNRASVEDISSRLVYVLGQEGIEMQPELINLIAQRSEGSYRESLMILDQLIPAEIRTIEQYNDLQGEVDYGPRLIRSTLDGSIAALRQLESVLRYTNSTEIADRTVETLRDLMLLKGGLPIEYTGEALTLRTEVATKVNLAQLLKGIKIIWDLQTKLNAGDPVRGLEMTFAMLGEVFGVNKEPQVIAPAAQPRNAIMLTGKEEVKPLTFVEMQRLRG